MARQPRAGSPPPPGPEARRAREPEPLPRSFYARPALTVARELLGCILCRRLDDGTVLRGRIVETEAYVGEEDKACHARAGRTPRTDPLYGPPGLAYVYFTYGMHYMLNAVAEPEGFPAAILIRAAEPLEGIEHMARARGADAVHIAAGPARLTQAFGIDLRHNRADLRGPEIWIEPGEPVPDDAVGTSARIGCQTAAPPWDKIPWRFYVAGNPHVTPGTPRGRPDGADPRRERRSAGGAEPRRDRRSHGDGADPRRERQSPAEAGQNRRKTRSGAKNRRRA